MPASQSRSIKHATLSSKLFWSTFELKEYRICPRKSTTIVFFTPIIIVLCKQLCFTSRIQYKLFYQVFVAIIVTHLKPYSVSVEESVTDLLSTKSVVIEHLMTNIRDFRFSINRSKGSRAYLVSGIVLV
jgi:hypothetical protein